MSRRNVVRVNIRYGASARQKSTDRTEPVEKRQKVTHDFFPTKPLTPRPIEKKRTESSAAGGSKAIQKPMGSGDNNMVQEFAPSFASADGRLVIVEDSVKSEPNLAVTMLQGLALPRDMERVPQDLGSSLVHASAYLL